MKKYLNKINFNKDNNLSNKIDILEKKVFKFLISFLFLAWFLTEPFVERIGISKIIPSRITFSSLILLSLTSY